MEELIAPEKPARTKKPDSSKPKGLGLKQLLAKKYKMLENLPDGIKRSFGELTEQILMIIYGPSGNGKSRLTMDFLKIIMDYGDVMYLALEEGHRRTMQKNAEETLNVEQHSGKITFWDHRMTYEELVKKLRKKKSPKFVVIDSLQYWRIKYDQYVYLKESFPNKGFIFISHAQGKYPDGKLARDIEYDVDIKVRVEGFVAFVKSRYGGNKPYVIYEGEDNTRGAWGYWTKRKLNQFKK
jgi:uridine kinase